MRPVPESEVRFLLKRGLQELSRSTLADLVGNDERRQRGLNAAVDVLAVRFARLTVTAPDPERAPGQTIRRAESE